MKPISIQYQNEQFDFTKVKIVSKLEVEITHGIT